MQGVKSIVMVEHYSKSAAGYFRDEPSIISQIKVGLRPIIYKTSVGIMKMFAKNNSLYFLAQSPLAKQVMVKAGIDPRSIFCFGYFIPKDASVKTVEKTFHKPINAIYVGSMIKRKGVDLVIDALADINSKQKIYQLDIYGPGSFKWLPRHEAHGVTFKGILPQDQVQKTIAKYDLLILPSRHDGWGVVVNEALLQGVPVLVSDEAGASCLVKAMQAGMLFISGDKNDLKSKLLIFNDRKLLQEFRSNAQEVGNMITPDIAAKYLLEVLQFFFESDQRGNFPRAIWSEDL
jgi:glycosyltransferase involved in cell wall biosynthesis